MCVAEAEKVDIHALRKRLTEHAASRWPHIDELTVRQRAGYVYVGARLAGEAEAMKLCRLRATEDPERWHVAVYRYSNERYDDESWGLGPGTGTMEQALDSACQLYVEPAAAMQNARRNLLGMLGASGGPQFRPNRAERRRKRR